MALKVILYEDNEPLRISLESLLHLQQDIELMAAMPNAQTILKDLEELKPDVILMDIDMPEVSGVKALKLIRKKYPDIPVIMLTIFDDNENIYNAICAGANGYLLKKNFDLIVPSIKDVMNGGAPMTSSVARQVLQLFPKPEPVLQDEEHLLSPRETQLLQLLSKGYSYKMIADKMNIALETVRTHIKKIYRKLQVNSATEATFKANKDHLI